MRQIKTSGIILARTDYAEADRILNFITPDHGKLSGIAKGVRKSGSKLAGSIELFSVSQLSFIIGRSEIYTITSARLIKHYHQIVADLERTNIGYELVRILNKATQEAAEPAYFHLLQQTFEALDDSKLDPQITDLWFKCQIIKLAGHTPDLRTTTEGQKLSPDKTYNFDLESMHFFESGQGIYSANHIKFLRICFAAAKPEILHKIEGVQKLIEQTKPLINQILQNYIRV